MVGKWGHYGEFDMTGIEGAFSYGATTIYNSVCKYNRDKGVLSMNAYFYSGKKDTINEGVAQRVINRRLKKIIGTEKSLCICTNGTRRRSKSEIKSGEKLDRYVNVEYYAKVPRPDPDTVTDMSKAIRECISDLT